MLTQPLFFIDLPPLPKGQIGGGLTEASTHSVRAVRRGHQVPSRGRRREHRPRQNRGVRDELALFGKPTRRTAFMRDGQTEEQEQRVQNVPDKARMRRLDSMPALGWRLQLPTHNPAELRSS